MAAALLDRMLSSSPRMGMFSFTHFPHPSSSHPPGSPPPPLPPILTWSRLQNLIRNQDRDRPASGQMDPPLDR